MASSRRNLFLSILLCPVFCFSLVASGRCFWIDGTEVINRFPCYDLNSVGASMCCDSTLRDYFVGCDHGICVFNFTQGVEGPNDEGSSFWRDSCTDPTWMDPACLAMAPEIKSSEVRLNKCGDRNYCPRNSTYVNETCCENRQGQFAINDGAPLPRSTASTAEDLGRTTYLPTLVKTPSPSPLLLSFSWSSSTSSPRSTMTSNSSSPPNIGDDPSGQRTGPSAATIATILGSVFAAITVVLAVVFGINGWRKNKNGNLASEDPPIIPFSCMKTE